MMKNFTLAYFIGTQSNDEQRDDFKTGGEMGDRCCDEYYEPSERCIDAILNFARSYDVLNTNDVGSIELILN